MMYTPGYDPEWLLTLMREGFSSNEEPGYTRENPEGLCTAIAGMGMQAILSEDLVTFDKRLDLIYKMSIDKFTYAPSVEKFKDNINILNQKLLIIISKVNEKLKPLQQQKESGQQLDELELEKDPDVAHAITTLKKTIETLIAENKLDVEQEASEFNRRKSNLLFNAYKQKLLNKEMLEQFTDDERIVLGIRAFFDGIQLYQQAYLFPELFEKNAIVRTQNIWLTAPVVLSKKLTSGDGIAKIKTNGAYSTGVYDLKALTSYFDNIRLTLNGINKPVAFILCDSSHSITVGYDPNKDEWLYIDANHLPTKYIYKNDIIAKKVISAFSHNGIATFSTDIYSDKTIENDLQNRITQLEGQKNWKDIHTPSPETVKLVDSKNASWLFLAAKNGHVETVKTILKADVKDKVNDVINNITALWGAAEYGHDEVVEVLLNNGAMVDAPGNEATALMIAAQNGHDKVVDVLLKYGARVSAQNIDGFTALMIAAQNGHDKVVKVLLNKGAIIDDGSKKGFTALMIAAEYGHDEVVEVLLNNGAKAQINNKYKAGFTALMYAAQNGYDKIVEVLLNNGAMIDNRSKNGFTALMHAAQNGHDKVVEVLLKYGAKIDDKDYEHNTVLMYALNNGHNKVVEVLLKYGALDDANNDYVTALIKNFNASQEVAEIILNTKAMVEKLMLAAEKGNVDEVETLLKNGTRASAKNLDGFTALTLAVQNGHVEVVKALLKAGAKVDTKDPKGNTALTLAVQNDHVEVVKALLKAGAKVDTKDPKGNTALTLAVQNDHVEVVKALLEAGANAQIEDKNKTGFTALTCAARNGHDKVVEVLLKYGAKIDDKDYDCNTALMYAAENGHVEVVKALLEAGAKAQIEDKNKTGFTALTCAARNGHDKVVEVLLKYGAKIDAPGPQKIPAFMYAVYNGHDKVLEVLLENGAKPVAKSLIFAASKGYDKTVEVLLKYDFKDVNDANKSGDTALHIAARCGHAKIVDILLENGADLEISNKAEKTAADIATDDCLKIINLKTVNNKQIQQDKFFQQDDKFLKFSRKSSEIKDSEIKDLEIKDLKK